MRWKINISIRKKYYSLEEILLLERTNQEKKKRGLKRKQAKICIDGWKDGRSKEFGGTYTKVMFK